MGSTFKIAAPGDYVLRRDVCSYGYFLLAPNRWEPRLEVLRRPLQLPNGTAEVIIGQPEGRGRPLLVKSDRSLDRRDRAEAERQIRRMLRLDEAIAPFHRADPRWKRSGRGRIFRSPTFFEDLVKTVTSCNVTWPSTIVMNRRLCEVIHPAFPSAAQMARRRPATLRAQCRVGYRDGRLVQLAKLVASRAVDPEWFEDSAKDDETIYKALLELPGIGPYAAANVMQLLGRYSRLAIDTESVRHGRTVLGLKGSSRQVEKAVRAHFEPFGDQRFRSYWFELWTYYEKRHGPAWTWERDSTGKLFTAAELAD